MDAILVKGGNPLKGEVVVSGAKNASLPIIAATLLTADECVLSNVPDLKDIESMTDLLTDLGSKIKVIGQSDIDFGSSNRKLQIDNTNINKQRAEYDLVRKMRASIWVLGPLLARFGYAEVSLPGGCAIGARPVDLHIKGLEALGAKMELREGYIYATAPKEGLKGAEIVFEKVSVGATGNVMMAATLAKGITTIRNAACEPEMVDLAQFLNKMGAKISGAGTSNIQIEGVKQLKATSHKIIGDRIEAGTYAVAAAITKGDLTIKGINVEFIRSLITHLSEIGVVVEGEGETCRVAYHMPLMATNIDTLPFPHFPTDLQAQMMSLLCVSNGVSIIKENIFENRFMHVPELQRMGANITLDGNIAVIAGVKELQSAKVMATDLRASVALVLAALSANGESTVNRVYHLDRGYENLVAKLQACGANIQRVAA